MCPKCNDEGGKPIDWTDGFGLVHHDFQWCDCDAARRRLDRAERDTWWSKERYGT